MLMLDAAIREHWHAPPDCVLKCVIGSILRDKHCSLEGLEPFRSFLSHWMAETQEKCEKCGDIPLQMAQALPPMLRH
jgi:hypothetical protein